MSGYSFIPSQTIAGLELALKLATATSGGNLARVLLESLEANCCVSARRPPYRACSEYHGLYHTNMQRQQDELARLQHRHGL